MTVHTLRAGAPNVAIRPGMRLVVEAIHPTTGADVAGVTCTRWSIYGYDKTPAGGSTLADEVPRWTAERDEGG